jgi:hypothetical protein
MKPVFACAPAVLAVSTARTPIPGCAAINISA